MARVARVVPARPHVVVPRPPFATVDEAIADIRAGRMVIVVDDEDRENEGDLTLAAELTDADDVAFIRKYASGVITVKELIAYRMAREKLVERVATAKLPTEYGEFVVHGYRARFGNTEAEHVALTMGDVANGESVLVRVDSECLTGHVFGSQRCDCREQLEAALARIAKEGRGVFLYLRQEGRGIGLMNKLRAYALQDQGLDTVEANEKLGFKPDQREYGIGVQILLDLGVRKARILTNNPHKLVSLYPGLEVVERVPIEVEARATNRGYLATKRTKLGHLLSVVSDDE